MIHAIPCSVVCHGMSRPSHHLPFVYQDLDYITFGWHFHGRFSKGELTETESQMKLYKLFYQQKQWPLLLFICTVMKTYTFFWETRFLILINLNKFELYRIQTSLIRLQQNSFVFFTDIFCGSVVVSIWFAQDQRLSTGSSLPRLLSLQNLHDADTSQCQEASLGWELVCIPGFPMTGTESQIMSKQAMSRLTVEWFDMTWPDEEEWLGFRQHRLKVLLLLRTCKSKGTKMWEVRSTHFARHNLIWTSTFGASNLSFSPICTFKRRL